MVVEMLKTLRLHAQNTATINRGVTAVQVLLLSFLLPANVSTADITGVRSASKTAEKSAVETHGSRSKSPPEAAEETGVLRCWQSGELIIDEAGIAFLPVKDGSTMVTFGLKGIVTRRVFMEGDTTCLFKGG